MTLSPDRSRWWRAVALSLLLVALAHLCDEIAWRELRDPRVNDRDWGRFLRSVGYLPTWIALAAGVLLTDAAGAPRAAGASGRRPAGWGWRGGALIAAPVLGGLVAEALKLLLRRLRPDETVFGYAFRAYTDAPFSTRGLGLPSSHVLVAFAGAVALARVFPKAWPVGYVLAAGCALTRVLTTQHYLSDVALAAALGWLVADPLTRWMIGRIPTPSPGS